MFRVGQKVVCVNANDTNEFGIAELVEGAVYTIRRIDGPYVWVVENLLRNDCGDDKALYASRFRPIVERKTDISFAHEILRSVSEPVHSEAQS